MNIVCLGASFTGRYLAERFAGSHKVAFLCRNPEDASARGYTALTDYGLAAYLLNNEIGMVLDTVPAIVEGGILQDPPYLEQVEGVLRTYPAARYVHISTTSVYGPGIVGNDEAELPTVNENTLPAPAERGLNRLMLENCILALYPDAAIVRSGALYGPGRCIALRFRSGDFRPSDGANRMTSRIHVHDLCRLAIALAERRNGPAIVNGVDERPSPNSETYAFIEKLIGKSVPGNWRESPPVGRRVASLYAKELLGGRYVFPTYREGFAACLAESPG
jgi:nucleoside-diphosphate-sugar epimerase